MGQPLDTCPRGAFGPHLLRCSCQCRDSHSACKDQDQFPFSWGCQLGQWAWHPWQWGRGTEEGGLDEQIGLCRSSKQRPRVLSELAISSGSNAPPASLLRQRPAVTRSRLGGRSLEEGMLGRMKLPEKPELQEHKAQPELPKVWSWLDTQDSGSRASQ